MSNKELLTAISDMKHRRPLAHLIAALRVLQPEWQPDENDDDKQLTKDKVLEAIKLTLTDEKNMSYGDRAENLALALGAANLPSAAQLAAAAVEASHEAPGRTEWTVPTNANVLSKRRHRPDCELVRLGGLNFRRPTL